MSDTAVSLIRTYVPIVAGTLITWLASLGVVVGPEANTGLVVFLTGLAIAVYYTAVRLLAKRWPILERLLGSSRTPEYTPPPDR